MLKKNLRTILVDTLTLFFITLQRFQNSIGNSMIRQCAILFGCLALGELIVYLTGIKLPSSIIGMLLLTLFLKLGWIKLHWVQGMSDFLVANLGFFFIPPGVALMLYFDIIAAQFWPIVIATLVSTLLVLVITGWVHQLTRKLK
ncbi:LrgA family protein [Bacteroides fragilis 3_1_12]|nr:LrgA family protein [Bacteroides fragilis 3_1_12]